MVSTRYKRRGRRALGPDRVHCVMMPSPYTSRESLEDAASAAEMLGVKIDTVPIGPAMEAFEDMLSDHFEGSEAGIAEENIQSRSRGLTLMALSNKLGAMVLSTGNKSEMSVGYATLYGDMCGMVVLKDVYKMTVFELSSGEINKTEWCIRRGYSYAGKNYFQTALRGTKAGPEG